MSAAIDLARVRADFPALRDDVARFDGPGGTQVPQGVIDAMVDYFVHHNANTHWNYPASQATDAILWRAREHLAAFLGGDPHEVAFGANMTTLTFHAARGLARQWQPGDEVVVTELDHHGNIAPWQAVAAERGLVLRWLPMDPDSGTLRLDALPALLSGRTRLVAVGGASNALGTINDVAAVATMAREAGALTYLDAVHLAPHRLLDAAALGVDFIACSPYKFYGPHLGVLWGRRRLLDRLDAPRLEPAPSAAPERLETGTGAFESIAGAAAAVEWIARLGGTDGTLRQRLAVGFDALHRREVALFARLWTGLGTVPGLRRFGPPAGAARTGTVSFTLGAMPSAAVAAALVGHGCWVSDGDFYAATAARRCGVAEQGWIRVGLAAYSSESEVDRLVAALTSLAAQPATEGPLRSSIR